MSTKNIALREDVYKKLKEVKGPDESFSDFESIRPILADLFSNDTDRRGSPNYDPVLMVKALLLQQWCTIEENIFLWKCCI